MAVDPLTACAAVAGCILGLRAQGMAAFEAAVLGGYLHGLAGELARRTMYQAGAVAGDLVGLLPRAIRRLRGIEAAES